MKNRKLATEENGYVPMPQSVLDNGWAKSVHVRGWPAAYRFFYRGTVAGYHTVVSSRGVYRTRQPLMYTKRYEPK